MKPLRHQRRQLFLITRLYLPDPRTAQARIIEVACNAHARRKFYEARGTDALRSHQALAYYRQLYELERQAKDFSDAERLQMRQDLAVPILGQFCTWLEAQRPEVLPKSPMGEAIGYALNNWAALVRYTEAGFLVIEPWAYLRDVLTRLPATPAGQLHDLLPDHWQAVRRAETAIQPVLASDTTPASTGSGS
jgi:hypothetical protein